LIEDGFVQIEFTVAECLQLGVGKPAQQQIHFLRASVPAAKFQSLEADLAGFAGVRHRRGVHAKHIGRCRPEVNRHFAGFLLIVCHGGAAGEKCAGWIAARPAHS